MGEIADMIIDGLLDEETGEYIDGDAPGYPRRMSPRVRQIQRPALTIRWIKNYTRSRFYGSMIPKIRPIIKEYALLREWDWLTIGLNGSCTKIMEDFDHYKQWLKQKYNQ